MRIAQVNGLCKLVSIYAPDRNGRIIHGLLMTKHSILEIDFGIAPAGSGAEGKCI